MSLPLELELKDKKKVDSLNRCLNRLVFLTLGEDGGIFALPQDEYIVSHETLNMISTHIKEDDEMDRNGEKSLTLNEFKRKWAKEHAED